MMVTPHDLIELRKQEFRMQLDPELREQILLRNALLAQAQAAREAAIVAQVVKEEEAAAAMVEEQRRLQRRQEWLASFLPGVRKLQQLREHGKK